MEEIKKLLDISISNGEKILWITGFTFRNITPEIFEELKKLESIVFKDCHFYDYVPFLKNILYFDNCTFESGVSVSSREIYEEPYFQNCEFKCNITLSNGKNNSDEKIEFKGRIFRNCKFLGFKHNNKILNNNIQIDDIIFLDNIFFDDISSDLYPTFKINNCEFKTLELDKCKFNAKFIFKNCSFGLIEFNNCIFGGIAFNNCNFDKRLTIKSENKAFLDYFTIKKSFFSDLTIIDNIEIESMKLENLEFDKAVFFTNLKIKEEIKIKSIFYKKIDFNGINFDIKKINRETARIIKDSFDQQNNIIEANKFYALEMKERENELEKDLKEGKNFFEWLVFKIHGISSNHSQDWLLALYWIFIIGFISSYFDFNLIQHEGKYVHYELSSVFKTVGLILVVLFFYCICKIKDKFVDGLYFIICFYLVYIYSTKDYLLSLFSKTINPFSVMKTNDPINGIQLFFKIIVAYLIYQLIISIRQNTRRK